MRAIVIYATHEGQTDSIGREIAARMRGVGLPTDTYNVAQLPATQIALESYDAVVFGSPLHWGAHDSRIGWCMKEHRWFLESVPSAFFSVSLSVASDDKQERQAAIDAAKAFVAKHRLRPQHLVCFAGALKYSRYGLIKKRMMHMIAKRHDAGSDMMQDYQYTDWDRVDHFAEAFARKVIHDVGRRKSEQSRRRPAISLAPTF